MRLTVNCDDGFVAWINGVEVGRANVLGQPTYTSNATTSVEPAITVVIQPNASGLGFLENGTNVLAVQAFNNSLSGSDFRIDAQLEVWRSDPTPPSITNVVPPPGSTVGVLTQVVVWFNKGVFGVEPTDLLVGDQPAFAVSGTPGTNCYTFYFSQPPSGLVTFSWDESHGVVDAWGRPFDSGAPTATWSYWVKDIIPPTVVLIDPYPGSMVKGLKNVEVWFNEPVVGVDSADLLLNGQPSRSVSGSEAGPYVFSFTDVLAGQLRFSWAPGHGIMDLSSNLFCGGDWFVTVSSSGSVDVVISEFLAGNTAGLRDEDGEASDWIEIFNRGSNTVNLLGWSLTDDPRVPRKWVFPARELGPGQYLVVFASGKDRRVPGRPLHTNFKLSMNGEYLALLNAEYPPVAVTELAPAYPEQRNDFSYGVDPAGRWCYYANPTPGSSNGISTIVGIAPPPHFSVARGLFNQPFNLLLTTALPGAVIRYTLDGSEPTLLKGFVYQGPIAISNTTLVRAVTFAEGYLSSRVVTHSYIYLDSVPYQPSNPPGFPVHWGTNCGNIVFSPASSTPGYVPAYYAMDWDPLREDPNNPASPIDPAKWARLQRGLRDLPVVSIVMDVEDMFGVGGLYPNSSSANKAPNEKPCSVEMLLQDGSTLFAVDAGIDLHGNASRDPHKNPKHGFKLNFRGEFGPSKLECKLFEDSPVTEFDDLILRPDFNSSWRHWSDSAGNSLGAYQRTRAIRARDAWIKHTFRDMGHVASHNRYVHLFINGLYWGIYDFSEQPTKHFGAAYFGGEPDDYDALDQGILKAGTITAYQAMTSITNLADDVNYERLKQYLDVTQFIDYMLLHFFVGHQDWGNNKNWAALRKRVEGLAGRFRYFPWDGECILLDTNINRVPGAGGSPDVPSGLFTKLDDNAQFRLDFADRVHKHMISPDGALTYEANVRRLNFWMGLLDNAIVAESCRWGAYRWKIHQYSDGAWQLYTRENHWLAEYARLTNSYFVVRPKIVLDQLRTAGLYPKIDAPEFREGSISGRVMGSRRVPPGFVLVMRNPNPTGTIYFTTNGVDPRVYFSGQVSPEARVYTEPLTVRATMTVKARVLSQANWSALNEATFIVEDLAPPISVTEIMYNPPGGSAYEFIEIQNVGSTPVDIGGFSFRGINFVFPEYTVIEPGEVIVLANNANPAAFATRYPGIRVFGYFGGNLDNAGELVALLDRAGNPVVSVFYDDENGWPIKADGGGYSLEIRDPRGDPSAAANWRASSVIYGTPGSYSPPATQPAVIINELMAENKTVVEVGGKYPDWVELHNTGTVEVDLSGWSLSDGADPRKFVFPAGTSLLPGGYLVLWCDDATNSPGLHTGFALSRLGETVVLYDSATNVVDAVTYGIQLADYSIGRIDGHWELTVPTPGMSNRAAEQASQTNLVINEVMVNTPSGESGWIELFNKQTNLPVSMEGLWFEINGLFWKYHPLSFIGPGGFVRLFTDETSGPEHLGFKLPVTGGKLVLYDATASEVDRFQYTAVGEGIAVGRLPDGATNIVQFVGSASPGTNNYLRSWTGPVLSEVLARHGNKSVTPWGTSADFIELFNPTPTNFSLDGMALKCEVPGSTNLWIFPAGAFLPPYGYVVVWCDEAAPASTTFSSSGQYNAGFNLPGEGGRISLLDRTGQVVDQLEYGLQVEGLPLGVVADQWQLLVRITPGASNASPVALGHVTNLCINEWMAAPITGDDWVELFNRDGRPVDLSGLYLTDDPSIAGIVKSPIPPLSFIGGHKWALFIADGDPAKGANHLRFKLDADGETIRIYTRDTNLIDAVDFGMQTVGVSQGRLPDGGERFVDFTETPTPGAANYIPLAEIVINEVLTHTDPPFEDAIELYNPSSVPVDVSGWYLSDSLSDPRRFKVPAGTVIPPGGFKVFYQYEFGTEDGEDDVPPKFALSSVYGDSVYLFEADQMDRLTGRRAEAHFGPAPNGYSFGRFPTSVGVDFVLLSRPTFGVASPRTITEFRTGSGAPNAYPLVGPVVISEIMYWPPAFGTNNPEIEEFIELMNVTDEPVPLYDPVFPTNTWRLANAVRYSFPTGSFIPPRGLILIVPFDPVSDVAAANAFRARYNTDAQLYGPYSGRLDNAGETIELLRPDTPQLPPKPNAGYVPYVVVERVSFLSSAPWPIEAAGTGASLQRKVPTSYGNDPINWYAGVPTPGRVNLKPPVGRIEFKGGNIVELQFTVEPGQKYQLQFKDDLLRPEWSIFLPTFTATSEAYVINIVVTNTGRRFYRMVLVP